MHDETVRELHVLASRIAKGYPGVSLVSVAASDGEAESVELLMSIERADADAEKVMMRVPRERQAFEAELRRQIEALPSHHIRR